MTRWQPCSPKWGRHAPWLERFATRCRSYSNKQRAGEAEPAPPNILSTVSLAFTVFQTACLKGGFLASRGQPESGGWPFADSVSCLPTSASYLSPRTLNSCPHFRATTLGPVLLKPSPPLFAGNPQEAAKKPFGNRAQPAERPQLSAHRP